jgi:hypothetical protein
MPQIEQIYEIACCLAEAIQHLPEAPVPTIHDYQSRFLILLTCLTVGRTPPGRFAEIVSNILIEPSNSSSSLSSRISPTQAPDRISTGSGTSLFNTAKNREASRNTTSPWYPSNDLIPRVTTQNTAQHAMMDFPIPHVSDMSPHHIRHGLAHSCSTSSVPKSISITPCFLETNILPQQQDPTQYPVVAQCDRYSNNVKIKTYDSMILRRNIPVDPTMYKR